MIWVVAMVLALFAGIHLEVDPGLLGILIGFLLARAFHSLSGDGDAH